MTKRAWQRSSRLRRKARHDAYRDDEVLKMREMAGRKVPIRTCVGCQRKRFQGELLRVVRTPEGRVMVDRTGKAAGRGAYLCPDRACFEQARKKRRLARTLRTAVPDAVYSQVEQWLDG